MRTRNNLHDSCIYAIRCKVNGKVYVGRTTNLPQRIRQHWQEKRHMLNVAKDPRFRGELTRFEREFGEYGQDSFEVYVLEQNVPPEECRKREAYWIAEYDSTNPKFGYNISRGNPGFNDEYIVGLPPNLSKVSPNQLIPKKEE